MISVPAGYALRAARLDEIPGIARFIIEYDLEIGSYSDFTEDDLREISKRESIFDIASDTWLVTRNDDIAAFALTWRTEPGVLNAVGLVKRSEHGQGLGSMLIECVEDRARSLPVESVPEQTIAVRNSLDVKDRGGIELLTTRGYELVRHHYTMRTMLDRDIVTEIPNWLHIRSCELSDAPLLHRLLQETFADHWGHAPVTYEEWSGAFLSRRDSDPSMWFVAEYDDEPIGFLIGTSDEERGWVADLGVVKPWRSRGVGGSLLRHAFADFRRRGFTEAGLEVDAGNETGAVRVYERAGMAAVKVYESYEKRFAVASKDDPGRATR